MSGIVSILMFLWTIVQAAAFWLPGSAIIDAIKSGNSDLLFFGILGFIIANMLVGFLTIFVIGEYNREDIEKHFLFKTIVNGLLGGIRLPLHIISRLLLLFFSGLNMEWGCYDGDNWVSVIIYSATLLDVEPSWGDFPDRLFEHESPRYVKKYKKAISKEKYHAMKPYVEPYSDGKVHGANDVLGQARAVAKSCSTFVWEYGNRVNINFTARLSGDTIYFTYSMTHYIKKPFKSLSDKDSFENMLVSKLETSTKEIKERMNKWSSINELDGDYYISIERGNIDF